MRAHFRVAALAARFARQRSNSISRDDAMTGAKTAATENEPLGDHSMARTKPATKTITMPSAPEEAVPEPVTQGKRPDGGRFRLQVDRQTKASYATYEAAETAGKGIKKNYPILQVAVYDGVESVNKVIELP
jgi:hypothetical protein